MTVTCLQSCLITYHRVTGKLYKNANQSRNEDHKVWNQQVSNGANFSLKVNYFHLQFVSLSKQFHNFSVSSWWVFEDKLVSSMQTTEGYNQSNRQDRIALCDHIQFLPNNRWLSWGYSSVLGMGLSKWFHRSCQQPPATILSQLGNTHIL